MPEPWDLFLDYAAFARAKPAFDLEERERPLALAAAVRAALERLDRGQRWLLWMSEALSRARRPGFVYRHHTHWFEAWAGADQGSLEATLAGLSEQDPTAGIASFSRAAREAAAAGRLEPDQGAVLTLGSLFKFALDPHSLPIVQPEHFRPLRAALGYHHSLPSSPEAEYESHLDFARAVRERLLGAGVSVRDMLDAQALIRNGALHLDFWGPGRGAPIEEEWDSRRPYLSICAMYRDEAPYLREWIEFHRLVGVERFFLYNNLSGDDHRQVLAPYVEAGVVIAHEWPKVGGQLGAYEHCVEEHRDESRWIAFIDLDEFIFSPTGRQLPEVLGEYESFPGVGVNWAMFGPSGHQTKPPGLVTESYLQRLFLRTTIKSVVNPRHVAECWSVHNFRYDRLSTVDENKYPISGGWTKSESCERLRVNHYFTKSVEEYRLRCVRPNGVGKERRFIATLADADAAPPGDYDDVILRYLPALRDVLSEGEGARPLTS